MGSALCLDTGIEADSDGHVANSSDTSIGKASPLVDAIATSAEASLIAASSWLCSASACGISRDKSMAMKPIYVESGRIRMFVETA
jgi:hypothetical protein